MTRYTVGILCEVYSGLNVWHSIKVAQYQSHMISKCMCVHTSHFWWCTKVRVLFIFATVTSNFSTHEYHLAIVDIKRTIRQHKFISYSVICNLKLFLKLCRKDASYRQADATLILLDGEHFQLLTYHQCWLTKIALLTPCMGLLPDTLNYELCMCREGRERFSYHRGLAIMTCITARASRTHREAWGLQSNLYMWDRWTMIGFATNEYD